MVDFFPECGFDDIFLVVSAGVDELVGVVVVKDDLARHAGCDDLKAAPAPKDETGEDRRVMG